MDESVRFANELINKELGVRAAATFADTVVSFMKTLINGGVPKDQALYLTGEFVKAFVGGARSMGKK